MAKSLTRVLRKVFPSSKELAENYLSHAANLEDLERRQRELMAQGR